MNEFAALLDRLAFEPSRLGKLRLMTDYFRTAADPERGYALAALTGALSFQHAKPALIRALIGERVDPYLFGLSYDYVGDLSETVALLWPTPQRESGAAGSNHPALTLADVVHALATTGKLALPKILADDRPALVIWQAGTVDALRGVEPDDFRNSLDQGLNAIAAAGADVIMMNMQYSPRTDSMLSVAPFADVMHWVAEQRGVLLFDRLGIMHYWSDEGTFDLYAATTGYAMARCVHECIGRALASQIVNAAHLDAAKMQTTR